MCGIVGKINFNNHKHIEPKELDAMCQTIIHRGPDDQGFFIDKNFGFAMRRLSIIDLAGGHQPIFNENNTVGVILNGEIYNFPELHDDLLKRGHIFKTKSDTEVIVHLYEEYGENFVEHLNGMFAIALYDLPQQKLILVRDRLGIKPLYYSNNDNKFLFASEIKAILTDASVDRTLDLQAVDLYFSLMYIPAPYSIFKNIKKLPAGHLLICENNKIHIKKYWDVSFDAGNLIKNFADAKKEFLELFEDSTQKMLLSDVPLGAFLSGGIDSSGVVAMMKRATKDVKTFTIGFKNNPLHDESNHAEQIAKEFKTDHHLEKVDGNLILNWLDDYTYFFDEPFADYAAFPTHTVAQVSRKNVKVVLTGDGCDEIFAGYERYSSELLARYFSFIPAVIRNYVFLPLFKWGQHLSVNNESIATFFNGAIKKTELMKLDEDSRYIEGLYHFPREKRAKLFNDNAHYDSNFVTQYMRSFIDDKKQWDFLSRRLFLDIKTTLPEQMLTKIDRTTMAVSLEARVPFLDHRLVEFSARVPSSFKIKIFKTKKFVRDSFDSLLPRNILQRPKHGFSSPMDLWIRENLRDKVQSVLTKENIATVGLFNADYILKLITEHNQRRANHGKEIFMILIFVLWHQRYIQAKELNK